MAKIDLRSSSFAPRQCSSELGIALGLASVSGINTNLRGQIGDYLFRKTKYVRDDCE